MGANTYIGNAPNFMVKSIAEENGIKMPSFFGYMLWSLSILVPLFISAFRRADELATAMECRCYHGGEGRTRLRQMKSAPRDYIALAVTIIFLAAVIAAGRIF